MLAVSPSRISPIITTLGAWRRMARSATAKVIPMLARTCTWLMPDISYSTGSSTVMILRSGRLMVLRQAYSVVVLPDPVGPVTRRIPSGCAIIFSKIFWSSEKKPSLGRPRARFCLSRIRMTMLSPWLVGTVETRRSSTRPRMLTWIRPSCGLRFSEIFIAAIILMRLTMADCRRLGGLSTSCSTPSIR